MRRAIHRDRAGWRTRTLAPAVVLALTLAAPGPRAPDAIAGRRSPADPITARHEWWNERWARIRSLEGLWQTSSDGARVRLRPEPGGSARIAVHSVLTGETVNYALESGGEVLIAQGWIVVNQRGEPTLAASGDAELSARAPGMDGHLMVPLHRVHRIEWSDAVAPIP